MFSPRHLAPLCAGLLFLAGCGGGSDPAMPGSPTTPTTPDTPTTPAPVVKMSALSGSGQHATVSWSGGSAGSAWRLERRREDGGDYALVAEVDSGSGLWLDGGLNAETGYSYRLSRPDGSVLATATARTGAEAVLTTPAAAAAGAAIPLPFTPTTTRLSLADGSLQLDLPAGSLSQAGTAALQPIANPLADGVGLGLSLSLPERPARTLTLSMRYGADEDVDEVLQDRIAIHQADGSWWLLPLAAHDEGQRLLQVNLPPGLWVEKPAASALQARTTATVRGVQGEFIRVKAHKLVPAAATVRVLGSQRFVPVSIYVMRSSLPCEDQPGELLCAPTPVLRDVQVPVLNSKAGFQRQWTLEGSTTPDATLGSLAAEPQAGVVYTAPAQVPATNPLTLRFHSVNNSNGRRLVLSAKIRVAEDAWVGKLEAFVGDLEVGHKFNLDTRWNLDAAQSTATRRVYRPAGYAEHLYTVVDPICRHTVSPTRLSLAQAQTTGQLVVDESTSPARYSLNLATIWNSVMTVSCPTGSTSAATKGGHVWAAEGFVSNGRIAGSDNGMGERIWTLARPQ